MFVTLSERKTNSDKETQQFGREFAERLLPGDLVAIIGPLGAGKTTFIKGICSGLGIPDVSSPTFTIVNCYKIPVAAFGEDNVEDFINEFSHTASIKPDINVNHIDLYRITDENEFIERGINEYLGLHDTITLVEWADHFPEYFKNSNVLWIEFEIGDNNRKITISRYK